MKIGRRKNGWSLCNLRLQDSGMRVHLENIEPMRNLMNPWDMLRVIMSTSSPQTAYTQTVLKCCINSYTRILSDISGTWYIKPTNCLR